MINLEGVQGYNLPFVNILNKNDNFLPFRVYVKAPLPIFWIYDLICNQTPPQAREDLHRFKGLDARIVLN